MNQERDSPPSIDTTVQVISTDDDDRSPRKRPKDSYVAAIRVKPATRRLLDKLLADANKKDLGRAVKTDELLLMALSQLTSAHIAELQKRSMRDDDWFERAQRVYIRRHGRATAEEFKRLVYSGQIRIKIGEDDERLIEDLRDNSATKSPAS